MEISNILITKKQAQQRFKTNLNLVINRLKILQKRKSEISVKSRKEIADCIKDRKYDKARIKVQHIIRDDYIIEAFDILEMFCELLVARFGLIEYQTEVDPSIEEALASVIWSATRLAGEVPELKVISEMCRKLYGTKFVKDCTSNVPNKANPQLLHRISACVPSNELIEMYMEEIARNYKVSYLANLPDQKRLSPFPENDDRTKTIAPTPFVMTPQLNADQTEDAKQVVTFPENETLNEQTQILQDKTNIPENCQLNKSENSQNLQNTDFAEPKNIIETTNFIKQTNPKVQGGVNEFDELFMRFQKLKNS